MAAPLLLSGFKEFPREFSFPTRAQQAFCASQSDRDNPCPGHSSKPRQSSFCPQELCLQQEFERLGASPGSVCGNLLDNVLARGQEYKQGLGRPGNWLAASQPWAGVCVTFGTPLTCLWQPSTMISFCWGDVRAKTISACSRRISSSCSALISFSSIPFTTAAVASLTQKQGGLVKRVKIGGVGVKLGRGNAAN